MIITVIVSIKHTYVIIANRNKKLINSPQDLFSNIDLKSDSVLITIGAGDIDKWVVEIYNYISLNV